MSFANIVADRDVVGIEGEIAAAGLIEGTGRHEPHQPEWQLHMHQSALMPVVDEYAEGFQFHAGRAFG